MNREEVKEEVARIILDNQMETANEEFMGMGVALIIAGAILDFLDSIGYDASIENALREIANE